MKKYTILFFVTILFIVTASTVSLYLKNHLINVNAEILLPTNAENTIVCFGKIKYAQSKDVYANVPTIAEKIYVKEGDRVNEGDILMTANEATLTANSNRNDNFIMPDLNNLNELKQVYGNLLNNSENVKETLSSNYVKNDKKLDIFAPCSGVVSSINTQKEKCCDANKPLMVVANSNKMQVELSINEDQISDLALGQKVYISGTGFKNSNYIGSISNISNEAVQMLNATGKETVIPVVVDIDNVDQNIKAGFTAKCTIVTSEDKNIIIAPYEAVKSDKDGNEYVYKCINNFAQKSFIKTEKEYPKGFEIKEGIKPGDIIIISTDKVLDDKKLIITEENSTVI